MSASRGIGVGRTDGVWIACIAAMGYAFAGQREWHGFDALAWLNLYQESGELPGHEWHTFFYPALRLGHALVAPFGGTVYEGGLAASAVGTALAVLLAHAAARVSGLDRGSAAFAALLVATCPAAIYFATVVEVPGVALPFAAMVWLLMARWARRPGVGNALLVGVGLAVGFVAHPAIALAGLVMLPLYHLHHAPRRWLPLCVGGGTALVVLLLGVQWLPVLVRELGGGTDAATAFALLERRSRMSAPDDAARVVVREWLVPHLPTTAMLLALLAHRGARMVAAGALLASVPFHVLGALLLLESEIEWGAYPLAIAGPSAIVAARHVRLVWLRATALALGLATGAVLHMTLQPDARTVDTRAALAAARAEANGRIHWLIGDGAGPDGRAWLTSRPDYHATVLAPLLLQAPDRLQRDLDRLEAALVQQATAGAATVVSSTTLDTLHELAGVPTAAMLDAWLARHEPKPFAAAGSVTMFVLAADAAATARAAEPR